MRQTYRQDFHSQNVVFLNRKIHIEDLDAAKPYCPEISQMYNRATTYDGSKYITVETEPQSCIYPQHCHERRNQYLVYENQAQHGSAAVQDSQVRSSLLPTNVSCLNFPALTSHCNMLGCHESSLQHPEQSVRVLGCQESSLQHSHQPVHAEGNNFATRQLMSTGPSQKQLMAALEFSEHVSFTDTGFYKNDYSIHIPALLPENINNAEFRWKHDYSMMHSGSLRASGKNTKNMLQNNDVMKNNFFIEDPLETVKDSDVAACLSTKRFACTARKRRKRINTPMQRKAANIRERRRMGHLNMAFERLKAHVPDIEKKKTLSRIETLKAAIYYINILRASLGMC